MKRIFALLLSLLIMLTLASCARDEHNEPPTGGDNSAQDPYALVIEEYKTLLLAKKNGEVLVASGALSNEIGEALVDFVKSYARVPTLGYATKDINGDGTKELVLLNREQEIFALLTLKEKSPVLLLVSNSGGISIDPDGTIHSYESAEDRACTRVSKLVNGKLEGLEFGTVRDGDNATYYKIENGVRTEITKQEHYLLDQNHLIVLRNYVNKRTGFRFVTALDDQAVQGAAPTVDFSTYEGILAAYQTMVESLSEYTESKWVKGHFDKIFAISDDETYDIFHSILSEVIGARPTKEQYSEEYADGGDNAFGYAKKDLSGDGIEELILMNDNYEIISVFTVKNGKAVLLEDLRGAWIDESGYFRKDVSTGGVTGRDGECFVYEIDGTALKCTVGVGYKVNVYLEKDRWYRIDGNTKTDISQSEGEALYAQYNVLPTGCSKQEYMKSHAKIEFLPLFERVSATQDHIKTYSSSHYVIGGDELAVSAVAGDTVTFSFKRVKIVGEFPEQETFTTTVEGNAIRDGSKYAFAQGGIKGYLEFAVNSAWLIVLESDNADLDCRAYLFNRPGADWN